MNKTRIEWVKNPDGSLHPAYIAGFFDGEGSAMILTIRRRVNGHILYRFRPVIKIQQKTVGVLNQIAGSIGYGHIDKSGSGYCYIINGLAGVIEFAKRVAEYTIVKRESLIATSAIAYLQSTNHRRNHPYGRPFFSRLLGLREEVFKANQRTRTGLKQKYSTTKILAEHSFVDDIQAWQKNRMRGIHRE